MGPQESAPESTGKSSDQGESGLSLTDPAPSSVGEESADAEATGAAGRGKCWRCPPWPCGWRAEPVASLFVKKVQDVHAVEISAFRCVFQMLVIIPCLIYRKGVLGSTAMILIYYAFQTTSLADATVISFSCPVFTSLFAWIFLKEKYSLWDAFFTLFTITGVILIVRPPFLFGSNTSGTEGSYSVHLQGTFAAIGHAVFAAMTLVILRKMGKSVDYFLSIWYYVILGLTESIIVLFILGEWSLPYCGLDRLFLILIGLLGLGGQILLTKAVQIEKAGPVAIMKTMDVVFAFIFQIIFFNDVPTWWTVGGALCVVASSTGAVIHKWLQSSK
ncbi:Transmembrane protein 20 [Heterocephalus glaber]|uniref:Transmembrane protein 20 n=1 Tax=Heterocephalus glaber TaxID=10181 RepID=G5C706_HETGA|nr:Transmembrane protein 20 [Heterocephalus glaber]